MKGLIDKTQRNSGEKDKEKVEERERIKRAEKKEKEESPRGSDRGKRRWNAKLPTALETDSCNNHGALFLKAKGKIFTSNPKDAALS